MILRYESRVGCCLSDSNLVRRTLLPASSAVDVCGHFDSIVTSACYMHTHLVKPCALHSSVTGTDRKEQRGGERREQGGREREKRIFSAEIHQQEQPLLARRMSSYPYSCLTHCCCYILSLTILLLWYQVCILLSPPLSLLLLLLPGTIVNRTYGTHKTLYFH